MSTTILYFHFSFTQSTISENFYRSRILRLSINIVPILPPHEPQSTLLTINLLSHLGLLTILEDLKYHFLFYSFTHRKNILFSFYVLFTFKIDYSLTHFNLLHIKIVFSFTVFTYLLHL